MSSVHLKNREPSSWNGQYVTFSDNLDRTLSFRQHKENTRSEVTTRNSLVQKIVGSKCGANPHILRLSALALCYYAADYASPVWVRSDHNPKLDMALNNTYPLITGCLKPTTTTQLYLLSGITTRSVWRALASQSERKKQLADPRLPMLGLLQLHETNHARFCPPSPHWVQQYSRRRLDCCTQYSELLLKLKEESSLGSNEK